MTDYKQLCAKVLAYYEGQGEYDFSNLGAIARDNAAFDAWQEIRNELKSALSEPEPEGPTDIELLSMAGTAIGHEIEFGEYEPETECAVEAYGSELIDFARAVLARWGNTNTSRSNFDG